MKVNVRLSLLTFIVAVCAAVVLPAQDPELRPTATRASASVPRLSVGQMVELRAEVVALGEEPPLVSGVVEFLLGDEVLGTATLSDGDAPAAVLEVALPEGIHSIVARYRGSEALSFSISAPPAMVEILALPSELEGN